MHDYDYTAESDQACLACSVIGCACDELINGCESEREQALAHVEKTYAIYRTYLDTPVRDYACPNLKKARANYLEAVDALMTL